MQDVTKNELRIFNLIKEKNKSFKLIQIVNELRLVELSYFIDFVHYNKKNQSIEDLYNEIAKDLLNNKLSPQSIEKIESFLERII